MKSKRLLGLLLLPAAASLCLAGCGGSSETAAREYSKGIFAMGTYMELTAYGEQAESVLDEAENRIREWEALWSTTDEDSEIYAANHSQGRTVPLSSETEELLQFALKMARQTGGALDPTIYPLVNAWGFISQEYRVPSQREIGELLALTGYEKVKVENHGVTLPEGMQLDLGAVGKGYAGELLADYFKEEGISSALLNIGGNIQMVGSRPDGTKWRIGIRNPFGEGSFGVLESEDTAVVTSGGYERYFTDEDGTVYWHILDPDTGRPAQSGLASATIIADSGRMADALSTSIFVMGLEEGSEYWKNHGEFDMLLVTQDGEIYLTEGIEDSFTLEDAFSDREMHVIRK
ncbi:MAG TPA: FAD:protein FMN transferase [Candidatus Choladousia intestinavium]|uniref:FAD:protein FMN transferase n=1 Tax=Candidatus Choladousia intestinavium TaxID=2840727 RepID=A0A9D1AAF2_9FIRM|nr:FAD:protein FMN transferase [Candidatus Choladousia intestinavium]